MTTALVLGGTGTVGSAVVVELARRGIAITFTYCRSQDRATALAAEHGANALAIDLADADATKATLEAQPLPDVVIHCAGISCGSSALAEFDVAAWQRATAVNVQSALLVTQWLARGHETGPREQARHVVLVGALDRAQSLPLPPAFAATQGALSALVMALGHELGAAGIFVNLVALGLLDGGLSRELAGRRRKDYETFSALRRLGTTAEAAKVIAWLALENTFIQGKVVSANGGI